jgi:hypothetical protein
MKTSHSSAGPVRRRRVSGWNLDTRQVYRERRVSSEQHEQGDRIQNPLDRYPAPGAHAEWFKRRLDGVRRARAPVALRFVHVVSPFCRIVFSARASSWRAIITRPPSPAPRSAGGARPHSPRGDALDADMRSLAGGGRVRSPDHFVLAGFVPMRSPSFSCIGRTRCSAGGAGFLAGFSERCLAIWFPWVHTDRCERRFTD